MVARSDERARIHDALIDLCFERGFAQVTVEALCERAGIDRLDFERQFDNLEDCFFQIYSGEADRYQSQAERAREGLPDWRDRVRATAYALSRYLDEDEKLARFIAIEARSAGERTLLRIEGVIEDLIDLLDEGRQELDDPDSLTRATAERVGGGVFYQIFTMIAQGPLPPEADIVPQLMYAVILPYLGPEAALEELRIPPPPDGRPT